MPSDSGTLSSCPLCGGIVEPFGVMRHLFFVEDLGGEEICIGCARKVVPTQVARAEDAERRWNSKQES